MLYMFQPDFPSIIKSSKLHIQRQAFVRPLLLEHVRNAIAHAQKQDFVFRAKRTSPFKSAVASVQSTTGTAEVCASAVVMLDTPCSEVVWRVLATHCIRQFPLHFPFHASPCAITFQLESNSEDFSRGQLKRDGTCAETRFRLSREPDDSI